MGSRAPDPPLLSLRGSAPRRPSGALPLQRPVAVVNSYTTVLCGAHGTPAAVPSRGLRLWSRARDPVLRGPGRPGAGASLHVPGRLLPVSCAIGRSWKRRAEVDRSWMRKGNGWSATGVAGFSTGHARGARCEHAWRLLCCQAGYCCALNECTTVARGSRALGCVSRGLLTTACSRRH